MDVIPLHAAQKTLGDEEIEAIREVFKSGWLTNGQKTVEFEKTFADFVGSKYGVATNSCSSALYLALKSLGLGKGDSVVVPVNTFVATANAVRWLGAEPVFCDVGEDGEICPTELADILEANENVKCVVPVHLYGFPCNIKNITRLGKKHSVKIVEDCAQAHGATFEGKKVGSFGNAGCFSFYATKTITTGEGGMLVTDSEEVAKNALLLRNNCQTKTPKQKMTDWHYDITDLGFSFRMSEIEAAIGLTQMKKLDIILESKLELARRYKEALQEIDGIEMLHDPDDNRRHCVFQLLEVKVEKPYPLTRNKLYIRLKESGIITGVHYIPLHYFSYFKKTTKYRKGDFPGAEALYSKILSLPMFPFMTEEEFQRINDALRANLHRQLPPNS